MPEHTPIQLLEELAWRGLLKDVTDREGLVAHLAEPANARRRAYAGFDPTADSLTIGNLVAIMTLVHFARAGHEPVVLMGGGTGLIGDPSGKTAERQLQTRERVEHHIAQQRGIFERVFDNAGLAAPTIVNNHDWLAGLEYITLLRDVGKHFSVNEMIKRDSVRDRLENREQGISYTEFSYMILQAYDFAHLHAHEGVTVQFGGSDQWGNIVAGTDLIRKSRGEDAGPTFGCTAPLVTKSDGTKFGKTESGAVWLTAPTETDNDETRARRTSAYAMYQFWLNAADEDAERFLKLFTLLGKAEIDALLAAHREAPGKRAAQRALAQHATALVHGRAEAETAEAAGKALFSGDISALPKHTLLEVLSSAETSAVPRARLVAGVPLLELLTETGLASSRREGREFLQNGSVSVNGRKAEPERELNVGDLLHEEFVAIRRGKKRWHIVRATG